MRIIILVSSLGAGGAERVAVTLCNAWAERGYSVTLVSTYVGSAVASYKVSEKVELIFLGRLLASWQRGGLKSLSKLIHIRLLIVKRKPDVVLSFLSNVNLMTILALMNSKIPLIIGERKHPGSQLGSWLLELGCRCFYRFADLMTVQTDRAAQTVGHVYSVPKQMMIIPNPVPSELLAYSVFAEAASRRPLRFVALGRLSSEKRFCDIIDAFAICSPLFPSWCLDIYGDGVLRKSLAAQIEGCGLSATVRLMGSTSDPWFELSEASAFVMASEFEGFPNALLEALSIGLPAVATDCPSGPRELTDNGRVALLVPVADVASLAAAMQRLMADPLLRKSLGDAATRHVRDRYRLDAVLTQWDQAFVAVGARR
jgi:glycosyltransferase involved in cell wall biosynthesis